jgi:hypothetical protein
MHRDFMEELSPFCLRLSEASHHWVNTKGVNDFVEPASGGGWTNLARLDSKTNLVSGPYTTTEANEYYMGAGWTLRNSVANFTFHAQ